MHWYKKLHWQIIVGLVLGLLFGIFAVTAGLGEFTRSWIAPFGQIFLNLLKFIAVPLVLASLITGVASLSDLRKLSRLGLKTISIYVGTTIVAIFIGLALVNLVKPGNSVPEATQQELQATYQADAASRADQAADTQERGPLQFLVDMVPANFFDSASDNANMLQIVFIALFLGIGLIQIPRDVARPVLAFVEGLNAVIIRLVDIIMLMAPLGVFALLADTIVSVAGDDMSQLISLMGALGLYTVVVVFGLLIHMTVTYGALLQSFTPLSFKNFLSGIAPAQLVAFSTSSSGATLPVTMERCEEKLGVSEEVSSFVLPLGATINMDGTALYQAVAAVFIAQALGMDLTIAQQLSIVGLTVAASIGTAAVPSAGIIMLVVILESIGVPAAGIALILGVDRILDMIRTVTNVTGDATVASVVAASEGQLGAYDASNRSDRLRSSYPTTEAAADIPTVGSASAIPVAAVQTPPPVAPPPVAPPPPEPAKAAEPAPVKAKKPEPKPAPKPEPKRVENVPDAVKAKPLGSKGKKKKSRPFDEEKSSDTPPKKKFSRAPNRNPFSQNPD